MTEFYLDAREILKSDREEYDRLTREVAEAVTRETTPSTVHLRCFLNPMKDKEGFDVVESRLDDAGGMVNTEIECDPELTRALIGLFSPSIMTVVFREDEKRIFARYDDGQVYFYLPDSVEKDILPDMARDNSREAQEVEGLDVGAVEGEEVTEGVKKALMEESPADEERAEDSGKVDRTSDEKEE